MIYPNPNLIGILPLLQEGVCLVVWRLPPVNGAGRARPQVVVSGIETAVGDQNALGVWDPFPIWLSLCGQFQQIEKSEWV
jgi:hypothetical protein